MEWGQLRKGLCVSIVAGAILAGCGKDEPVVQVLEPVEQSTPKFQPVEPTNLIVNIQQKIVDMEQETQNLTTKVQRAKEDLAVLCEIDNYESPGCEAYVPESVETVLETISEPIESSATIETIVESYARGKENMFLGEASVNDLAARLAEDGVCYEDSPLERCTYTIDAAHHGYEGKPLLGEKTDVELVLNGTKQSFSYFISEDDKEATDVLSYSSVNGKQITFTEEIEEKLVSIDSCIVPKGQESSCDVVILQDGTIFSDMSPTQTVTYSVNGELRSVDVYKQ